MAYVDYEDSAGLATEDIQIGDVQTHVLPSDRRVEVVGHSSLTFGSLDEFDFAYPRWVQIALTALGGATPLLSVFQKASRVNDVIDP